MSDGEVKRWELNHGNGCKADRCYAEISVQPDGEYILLSDHDRIVARLKKEDAAMVNRLHEQSKIMAEKDARITKQKRVIERLREQRNESQMKALGDNYMTLQNIERQDAEIAAIDKAEA